MKKLVFILLTLLAIQSCDTFRRMAGRPTSDEIQAKRVLIATEEESQRARQAELEGQRRLVSDSLKALVEIQNLGIEVRGYEDIADDAQLLPGCKYYVIVGVYLSEYNVNRALDNIQACGFSAYPLKLQNGNIAIGVSPTCRIADCLYEYKRISKLPFCPQNCWILDVER